jgi:peptide/nickel transport system substrate-binding protein
MTRQWIARAAAGAAACLAISLLAACSGSSSSSHSSGSGPSGTITADYTSNPFTANFNPFNPGAQFAVLQMVYEPLWFFNTAQAGVTQPWLATKYTWGPGGTSITFQLRQGVKWNDGQPFTAADVAYTFNLIKSSPALNSYGLPVASATANGNDEATVTFTKPVYTDLYFIAGRINILPQHIWSKISNKTTWTDPSPVGTGAFKVSKVNSQVLILTANPYYYMPGLPKVKTIEFLTYSNNNTQDAATVNGTLDWVGGFIPNIDKAYLGKNPNFRVVDIPLAVDFLVPNMQNAVSGSLPVREAISDAIDRGYISQSVYNGYAPPTDPEGLLVPNFNNVASAAARADSFGGADPAKAKQVLEAAGYKLGANGLFAKNGQPLSITVKVVAGWTDYLSILQILGPELQAAGIKLNVTQEAYSVWTTDQDTGNFQFLLDSAGYTPLPYTYYYDLLDSAVTRPIGTSETIGNWGRYHNPQLDGLLDTIAGTTDTTVQNPAFAQIESIVKDQLPDIPLMAAQDEIEFNGNHVTGFPTKDNPYAAPATWLQPDDGWVAARLAPAK